MGGAWVGTCLAEEDFSGAEAVGAELELGPQGARPSEPSVRASAVRRRTG